MKKILQILILGAFGLAGAKKVKDMQAQQKAWSESTDSIKTQ